MRINRTTDYAVRAIKRIYENGNELITSNSIAQEENIPHGVLMKVMKLLKSAGIIGSRQGRGNISGGYVLNKSINEITILEIVEVMEGPIEFRLYIEEGVEAAGCEDVDGSPFTHNLMCEYDRISDVLRREMNKKSVYDILYNKNE